MAHGSNRKPAADFEIRLVGPGLKPWRVPMRALARALNAVQRLMEPHEEYDEEAVESEEEAEAPPAPLHLIGIVARSAGYAVAARDPRLALDTLKQAGRSLANPEADGWGPDLLSPVEELSTIAKKLRCTVEFKTPGRGGAVLAAVNPDSYAMLSRTAFVEGEGSVLGYLERVGGATEQRCALRLPDQPRKMVYCTVETSELVRRLGQHIYDDVLVSGTVTWFRRTWRVRRVFVKDFEAPKHGSILETLDRIYEAGGKAWDETEDPKTLIREMRGG